MVGRWGWGVPGCGGGTPTCIHVHAHVHMCSKMYIHDNFNCKGWVYSLVGGCMDGWVDGWHHVKSLKI